MDKNGKIEVQQKHSVGGFFQHRVMQPTAWDEHGNITAAEPVTDWSAPQKNLILPGGYDAGSSGAQYSWRDHVNGNCHAGTGSTPNKAVLDGTFQQVGTTITRVSGAGVFASGNVGDFIKFAGGEVARINTFVSAVEVTADRSQTVSASAATIYDTSRLLLDSWVKATSTKESASGSGGYTSNSDAGTIRYWRTHNFSLEVAPATYTELGMSLTGLSSSSNLWSRIVLEAPVNVDTGQFLQVRYELVLRLGNYRTSAPITVNVTGWPRPYEIVSITPGTASGTSFDILLSEACNAHYATGRPINVVGALPVRSNISGITSTSGDFTVTTAAAHGKNPGDSVVIEGASPAGYNGTWTCAAGTTGSTIVVTDSANLGAGSGGTVRLSTPATWYDGEWTIASFPNANTIRVTNNTVTVPAGGDGVVRNNLNAAGQAVGIAFQATGNAWESGVWECGLNSSYKNCLLYNEANLKTGLSYGVNPSTSGSLTPGSPTLSNSSYNAATRTRTFTFTFSSSAIVSQTIRQIFFNSRDGGLFVTFEERQRKDDGFQLVLSYTVSWEPDLN